MTNREFHEVRAVMFGNPSPICKEQFGAQINRADQNKTVGVYGEKVRTAAGVPGETFMHVHKSMVSVVGNDI
jgi:uncharacterized UPF0160 family protein